MTEDFGIKLDKAEEPKAKEPKVVKVEPKVIEAGWESKLKVASAKAVAREFRRRGWKTAGDIEAHFREAKQVFVQLNVQNLLALFKEDN